MRQVRDLPCAGFRIVLELEVRRVACRRCGAVKRERLDFLADNPHFTKRFAFYVGRRCAQASIRDVAKELKLDWDTVKTLEMQYMRAQIARAGTPGPKAKLNSHQIKEARQRLAKGEKTRDLAKIYAVSVSTIS